MKVSLINPPPIGGERFIREGRCMQSVDSWAAIWPPLTLAIMASVARLREHQVDMFDGNVEDDMDTDAAVRRIAAFEPDVIVINTAFPSIEGDGECAAQIKVACPNATTVGFGVFFTLLDEQAMEACPAFDIGLCGEPEVTFGEMLDAMADGREIDSVAGTMRRDGESIVKGATREVLGDIDGLPFAARDLLHNKRYTLPHNGKPFTLVNVARGCPWPCIFCIAPAYYGKRPRRHSLSYVLDELAYCQNELDVHQFLFWEEIFTLDREFGMALCEAILRKGWKISWATTTRADQVDTEILQTMKRAGCDLLGLGIESSQQHILDNAQKRETVDDIRNAVALCKKVGLRTMGHFIFGLPGETPETAEKTIEFGVELGLDYMQCYSAVPYPKTPLGEMAREKGWLTTTRWQNFDFGGNSIMDTGSIRPDQVDAARERMFKRFYLRPGYIARQFGQLVRRPRQLLQASKFLNWMRSGSGKDKEVA